MKNVKKRRQRNNPHKLAQLQALYDLIDEGFNSHNSLEETILTLERESGYDNSEIIIGLKNRWNRHTYSDNSIKFLMASIYDYSPQIHRTSPEAQALLLLMMRIQDKESGLVAVKKTIFADAMGFGSKRRENIGKYLTELEDAGAIEILTKRTKGNRLPIVCRIDSRLSRIGKSMHVEKIEPRKIIEFTLDLREKNLKNPKNSNSSQEDLSDEPKIIGYRRGLEEVVVGDEKMRCGTLIPIFEDKKTESTACNNEFGDNTGNESPLCSNNDYTDNDNENQDIPF